MGPHGGGSLLGRPNYRRQAAARRHLPALVMGLKPDGAGGCSAAAGESREVNTTPGARGAKSTVCLATSSR